MCQITPPKKSYLEWICHQTVDHLICSSSPTAALMSFGKTLIFICYSPPKLMEYPTGRNSLKALTPYYGSSATAGVIIWYFKRSRLYSYSGLGYINGPIIIIIIITLYLPFDAVKSIATVKFTCIPPVMKSRKLALFWMTQLNSSIVPEFL